MRHLLRLDDWTTDDTDAVFGLAREYEQGTGPVLDGAAAMFFPAASLRTRASFERGAALAGLQPIVFPPESLDKDEAHEDVARYLAEFVDVLVVRHPELSVLEALAAVDAAPVVNAMTSENHPCEVLADVWALTRGHDVGSLRVRFVGADGNIARAWAEASRLFGFDLLQCCPEGLAAPGVRWRDDLAGAVADADVVVTDGPGRHAAALEPYRVTVDVLALAPAGVRFAPCPPFVRGREVTADALASSAFVGHGAKRALLPVQQAVLAHCLA
ncbi:ornithine carbamoyltransferase [Curtobacterium caseinilyticum]|uniref:Ornithine carbamoyltransferase n=1 Tax=Curtobacterium caseinilyticum TaxID=3055137 RepID=A0ABT7TLF9_9MICO|nr:ornithine carbamoyltransferase [Curtobacterium caseinilyticum]MDM7890425.1 ornithine carbamoyltransferase [Curtobacterium caseinilyticum]